MCSSVIELVGLVGVLVVVVGVLVGVLVVGVLVGVLVVGVLVVGVLVGVLVVGVLVGVLVDVDEPQAQQLYLPQLPQLPEQPPVQQLYLPQPPQVPSFLLGLEEEPRCPLLRRSARAPFRALATTSVYSSNTEPSQS